MTEAIHRSAATAELSNDGSTLTVSVPLTLPRRGGRKRMITPRSESDWKPQRTRVRQHPREGAGAGLPLEAAV